MTILGGEGLTNDATALTAYQVAIATVGSAFTVVDVLGKFALAVVVGLIIGIAVGWLGCRMLRFTETPVIENTMLFDPAPLPPTCPPSNWGRLGFWP